MVNIIFNYISIYFIYLFIIKYFTSKSKMNNISNIFKQRIKYLILWMIHYYSNKNIINKIKIDDHEDLLDLDLFRCRFRF